MVPRRFHVSNAEYDLLSYCSIKRLILENLSSLIFDH
jgi:hypothetical protein